MELLELSRILGVNIEMFFAAQPGGIRTRDSQWYVHFVNCATKQGPGLLYKSGSGAISEDALIEYAKEIAGDLLVFNAGDKERRKEFNAPHDLVHTKGFW